MLLVAVDAVHKVVQVAGGEFPAERPGGLVVAAEKPSRCRESCSRLSKSFGLTTFFWMTEKKISIWFSQDACTGVWIMIAFGCAWPAADGGLAAVVRAVVHDDEDPGRVLVLRGGP